MRCLICHVYSVLPSGFSNRWENRVKREEHWSLLLRSGTKFKVVFSSSSVTLTGRHSAPWIVLLRASNNPLEALPAPPLFIVCMHGYERDVWSTYETVVSDKIHWWRLSLFRSRLCHCRFGSLSQWWWLRLTLNYHGSSSLIHWQSCFAYWSFEFGRYNWWCTTLCVRSFT